MKNRGLLRAAFALPSEKSTWCQRIEGWFGLRCSNVGQKFVVLLRIEHRVDSDFTVAAVTEIWKHILHFYYIIIIIIIITQSVLQQLLSSSKASSPEIAV
jgi:hypothetical protein